MLGKKFGWVSLGQEKSQVGFIIKKLGRVRLGLKKKLGLVRLCLKKKSGWVRLGLEKKVKLGSEKK